MTQSTVICATLPNLRNSDRLPVLACLSVLERLFSHKPNPLLEGSRRRSYIEVQESPDADESAADQFAGPVLLPESAYGDFATAGELAEPAVREFAQSADVAPAIVVGRGPSIQRDTAVVK
jgi:hypothetical protein